MSNAKPSKQELVNALNLCQTTLKRMTAKCREMETELAVTRAVAMYKADARVTSTWLASDEYTELRGMLTKVLEKLDGKK